MEKKKLTELQRPVKLQILYQSMHSEFQKERKETERIFEETMAKDFPNFMKTLIYTSKKLNKLKQDN